MPVSDIGVSTINIDDTEVTTSANATGEFSAIIDIQIPSGYRYEFVPGHPLEMYVPAHESATVSATGGSTGTVSLSHDLVNSPAVRGVDTSASETEINGQRDLVVWDDQNDIQTGVASVDYDANEFDYTNSDGSADDLEVYYLWGDSAQVEFRTYTPDEERYEKELIKPMRSFHSGRVFSQESYITFPEPFTMMEKEHLKVSVKTNVDLSNWDVYNEGQSGSPGDFQTYSYADFSLPVRKVPMKQ